MIPISRPFYDERETQAIQKVIESGWLTQGPRVKEFEEQFAAFVGSKYASAVSNCTLALQISLNAIGVSPGDVVLTVSHSFIATANAIRNVFAEPVFVDVEEGNINTSAEMISEIIFKDFEKIDGHYFYKHPEKLSREFSPFKFLKEGPRKLGAIMVVHQLGYPCDIIAIAHLAKKFDIPLIEDAACAIGSEIYNDEKERFEKIGLCHGDVACFSFHPRKLLAIGEGGMVTSNNPAIDEKIRLLRHHGMLTSDLSRHQSVEFSIEKYDITAFNYRMSDLQAAVGLAQLEKMPAFLEKRNEIYEWYKRALIELERIEILHPREGQKVNFQSFPVRVKSGNKDERDRLLNYLWKHDVRGKQGVMCAHRERPYLDASFDLKASETASDAMFLLPCYHQIEKKDVEKIGHLIATFYRAEL